MLASRKICACRGRSRTFCSPILGSFSAAAQRGREEGRTRSLPCLWYPPAGRRWVRHVPLAVPFLLNCGARGDKTRLSRLATTTRGQMTSSRSSRETKTETEDEAARARVLSCGFRAHFPDGCVGIAQDLRLHGWAALAPFRFDPPPTLLSQARRLLLWRLSHDRWYSHLTAIGTHLPSACVWCGTHRLAKLSTSPQAAAAAGAGAVCRIREPSILSMCGGDRQTAGKKLKEVLTSGELSSTR